MQKLYEESSIQAIANAIRAKNGTSDTYKVSEMANAISSLPSGGAGSDIKDILEGTASKLIIPSGVTKLGTYCFTHRSTLKEVVLPETVTSLGTYAFNDCENLQAVNLPSGLTDIGDSAFHLCEKLAITEVPIGVTVLKTYVFSTNAMTHFTIHENVTEVRSGAFSRCANLTEVTFRGTPNSIASNAFNYCTQAMTINVPWAEGAVANAPWGAENATINYNAQ